MAVPPLRIRWLAVLGMLLIAAALTACGDSPAPTPVPTDTPTATPAPAPTDTPTPVPMATPATTPVDTPAPVPTDTPTPSPAPTDTPTPAPTATPTTTPVDTPAPVPTDTPIPASPTPEPSATVTQLDVKVDTGTVWQEVFDALTASEQSCIRNALGEESLESALDQPVLRSDTAEWEVSIFVCLAPESADALFLSSLIAEMEELSEAEESCLRELVADSDVAALVAAPEDSAAAAEFITGMVNCVPDLFLSVMLAELGVEEEELSEDGASCLRELVADSDVAALVAAPEDSAAAAEFITGMVNCVPDLFLSVMLAELGVEEEELSEDGASCLRELVADSDLAALIAAPEDSAMYVQFAAGLTICIPDLLLSSDPDPAAPTATATPIPAPTDTPTPTPVAQMSAAEVYSLVSPSIPFIETPTGTGSGVLIEGGYVVTNYHVVWPYEAVWVVFPDGTELQNVPVVGWDSMADLAVLGPVDVSAWPLKLEDGEGMAAGSELFLVGYPAEVEEFPEPSITRGILSRFRERERLGMTYLQTDAAIAGGQSGGALVNSQGGVVGISTYSFSEAGFGLATSATDDAPILEKLIQGEFTSGLGDRRFPAGSGDFEFDVELANLWDTRAFVLDAAAGTTLGVELEGTEDGLFRVYDPFGLLLEVDDGETGIESGAVDLLVDGIHFLQVEMFTGEPSTFDLTSTIRLKPFHDPDDGRTIAVGETVVGNIDFYFDLDWYSIRLEEGETVKISTDSINVDTLLYVDFPNSQEGQVVSDDDSGGGLSSTNSELVYRAPKTGEYFIAVTDAVGDGFGGYYLSVE